MNKKFALFTISLMAAFAVRAELKLPGIFGDHMVLQQQQADPIWGWDVPGTEIHVSFAGQDLVTKSGSDGKWQVKLAPLKANAKSQTLVIQGTSTRKIQDVLIGEVWLCSGQSNMGFKLNQSYDGDLEAAAADLPEIRLLNMPLLGTQEIQDDFKCWWQASTPETARNFSAVGFLFGRRLHEVLHVSVGLINNAWGGSAAEAWVRRSALENDPRFKQLIEDAAKREAELLPDQGKAELERLLVQWRSDCLKAGTTNPPWQPQNYLTANQRPGNIFAGTLHPIIGFGIKGVIWYQGEANAGRGYEYASLFPFLIDQWRKEWGQGDFPFYWVQLANYGTQSPTPKDSTWAELREAQTKALQLTNTGQAVIIDLGEGKDIHPRNKHDVAARLVRWALAKDYGMKLPFRSPEFQGLNINSNKATVTINCFGAKLRPFGTQDVKGFAICGTDKIWHWASGKMVAGNKIEVWNDMVASPVAVRYAWSDNPSCNLYSDDGLPVTPFRTDDFEIISKPKPAQAPK